MPIFRVKSVKIYTGQKNLHWRRQWRQWQLLGMLVTWMPWLRPSIGQESHAWVNSNSILHNSWISYTANDTITYFRDVIDHTCWRSIDHPKFLGLKIGKMVLNKSWPMIIPSLFLACSPASSSWPGCSWRTSELCPLLFLWHPAPRRQ